MHGFFATIFYIPLYNALIFLISTLPGQSVGLAVLLLTIIIRLILFPLSRSAIKTQLQMKQIEPELQRIRETVKDKQEQARQTMQVYKNKDINPFASFFLILIQFPILIALYQVFKSGLPKVDMTVLYHFVHAPAVVNMTFLGADVTKHAFTVTFAILAVITQFIQLNISLPKAKKSEVKSFQNDLAYSMNMQMKYIFPIILLPIALISPVIAIYLTTSNIFMICQELFVRRKMAKKYQVVQPQTNG